MSYSLHQRWLPVSYDDLRHEVCRLVEGLSDAAEHEHFAPRANLAETEKAFEFSLDLPGMKAEDVAVEFKDGQLWVSGERKRENDEQDKTFHRVERRYGKFRRVVTLGSDVDADKIEARYVDGVLTVIAPKAATILPKKINVTG